MTASKQQTDTTARAADDTAIVSSDSFPVRLPLRFAFTCFGLPFDARAERSADGPVVTLSADLGPLPFTAESAQGRQNLTAILEAADTGPNARFILGEGQAMRIEGRATLGAEPSPETIIAAISATLYPLKPYVELVEWFGRFNNQGAAVS